MPSRWDSATCGWRRRVFHYPPPTLMSRNLRLPRAIELRPLSLTPLKMRKVEPERLIHKACPRLRPGDGLDKTPAIRFPANVQAGAATQEIENPGPLFS